jgi:hypothetical protein
MKRISFRLGLILAALAFVLSDWATGELVCMPGIIWGAHDQEPYLIVEYSGKRTTVKAHPRAYNRPIGASCQVCERRGKWTSIRYTRVVQ